MKKENNSLPSPRWELALFVIGGLCLLIYLCIKKTQPSSEKKVEPVGYQGSTVPYNDGVIYYAYPQEQKPLYWGFCDRMRAQPPFVDTCEYEDYFFVKEVGKVPYYFDKENWDITRICDDFFPHYIEGEAHDTLFWFYEEGYGNMVYPVRMLTKDPAKSSYWFTHASTQSFKTLWDGIAACAGTEKICPSICADMRANGLFSRKVSELSEEEITEILLRYYWLKSGELVMSEEEISEEVSFTGY